MVHRVAFSSPAVQLAAADMEKTLFGSSYAAVRAAKPIFITSLPRAGTTLMLEVLYQFPSLATHLYRDMPFVMAPVMWSRLSGAFRKPAELSERAHGDGIQIGYDSPEAFEEILWRTFWPKKYGSSGIALWHAADVAEEARAFFVDHMRKIVSLRRPDRPGDGRYISKNNGNVARLELLGRLFPDAKVLVPVRQPAEHARSLLHQHRSFLSMHRETPFVRKYMGDIGHYEFGELHRPIQFPGLAELLENRDPLKLDYWIAYWIAAFEYVLAHRDKAALVSYEAACADGRSVLEKLCEWLEIPEEGTLATAAALFRSAPPSRPAEVDEALLARAQRVYAALIEPMEGRGFARPAGSR